MRLPIAAHQLGRVAVGRRDLVGGAFDEAHLQPAARQHVEPGHLLGDAHRVGPVGDRRAERQQPRALGFAGDDRQGHRHRNGQAGRGAVVLVDHDVEPDLVAQRELVEIAVQQVVADLRVVVAVRQHDAQRAALQAFLPGRVIGHFREIPDAHRAASCQWLPSTKAASLSAKASGCSQCGKWPASAIEFEPRVGDRLAPGLAIGRRHDAVLARPTAAASAGRCDAASASAAGCACRASSRRARRPRGRARSRQARSPAVARNRPRPSPGRPRRGRRYSARGIACMSAMSRSSRPPNLMPSGSTRTRREKRAVDAPSSRPRSSRQSRRRPAPHLRAQARWRDRDRGRRGRRPSPSRRSAENCPSPDATARSPGKRWASRSSHGRCGISPSPACRNSSGRPAPRSTSSRSTPATNIVLVISPLLYGGTTRFWHYRRDLRTIPGSPERAEQVPRGVQEGAVAGLGG